MSFPLWFVVCITLSRLVMYSNEGQRVGGGWRAFIVFPRWVCVRCRKSVEQIFKNRMGRINMGSYLTTCIGRTHMNTLLVYAINLLSLQQYHLGRWFLCFFHLLFLFDFSEKISTLYLFSNSVALDCSFFVQSRLHTRRSLLSSWRTPSATSHGGAQVYSGNTKRDFLGSRSLWNWITH